MKDQLHALLRYKVNAAFIFLAVLTLFVSCSKNDSPVTPPPPPAAATIATVTSPTGTNSGAKNTVITITGTNFITDLSKIQVKVNGKDCIVLTATATTITAKIPPSCGTGIVELFLNGTRYAGPVFNFIYTQTVSSVTNGTVGYVDGPLATAQFEEVIGISFDGNDNLYIAQYNKPRIRKISASGIASNLAGDGTHGYTNAQGVNAKFNAIDFCSSDPAGNVYVADQSGYAISNNRIRKIDANGNVTTVADVPFYIQGIKVGRSGNIYVSGEDDIAKYSTAGTLLWRLKSHGAGNVDGDTSLVQFKLFGTIEVDSMENTIYLTSTDINLSNFPSQLKKLDLVNKTLTTIAGDGTVGDISTGNALSCKFRLITCLVLDKTGGLYFGTFSNKICYLKNGIVSTIIDGAQGASLDIDGDVSVARIKTPYGLALDSQGNLFISCTGNNKIKKLVTD